MFEDYIKSQGNFDSFLNRLRSDKYYKYYRKFTPASIDFDNLKFTLPKLVCIPKDEPNQFREIFVYEKDENFILKLLNEYFYEMYPDFISKHVFSYKTGVSTVQAVRDLHQHYDKTHTYLKLDLSKYFNTPTLENIKPLLNKLEINREPYLSLFKNQCTYKDKIIDKAMGLLPGCPISAFLSNAYLKSFDDFCASSFQYYIRYSDDMIIDITGLDFDTVFETLNTELSKFDLKINMNKVSIFKNQPIHFLGCNIDEDIDISTNKFNKIKRTIKGFSKKFSKEKFCDTLSIKKFLSCVYRDMGSSIIRDTHQGGILGFCFSHITKISTLQQLDYYLLDKCRFLLTGSNNNSVGLLKGYTTDFFEQLGFVSFVQMFNNYQSGGLIYACFYYELLRNLQRRKPIIYNNDLINNNVNLIQFISDNHGTCQIDLRQNQITVDKKVVVNKDNIDNFPHYGKFDTEKLLELVYLANARSYRTAVHNETFIRIPERLYSIYSQNNARANSFVLLNLILFLYKNNKISIDFPNRDIDKYFMIQNNHSYFVIDKSVLNK